MVNPAKAGQCKYVVCCRKENWKNCKTGMSQLVRRSSLGLSQACKNGLTARTIAANRGL